MIRPAAARQSAFAIAALMALSACATPESGPMAVQRAFSPEETRAPRLVDVPPERRVELARKVQLQTPVRMPPEVTGAPPATAHSSEQMVVSQQKLAAAGVDTRPDVRVWVRQDDGTWAYYGPTPRPGAAPVIAPVEGGARY